MPEIKRFYHDRGIIKKKWMEIRPLEGIVTDSEQKPHYYGANSSMPLLTFRLDTKPRYKFTHIPGFKLDIGTKVMVYCLKYTKSKSFEVSFEVLGIQVMGNDNSVKFRSVNKTQYNKFDD